AGASGGPGFREGSAGACLSPVPEGIEDGSRPVAFAGAGFHDPLAPAQVPGRAARSGRGPQAARRRSRTAAGVSAGQEVEYVLLLGRRDLPTDGVRDYAGLLAAELRARGAQAEVVEADWGRHGWRRALAQV